MDSPVVAVVMGSASDASVMKPAADTLASFGIPHEFTIVSAHRTPERMVQYAKAARGRGIKIIIAGAGGAAHLPGMIASMTSLPVIGVPVKSSNSLDGWDSLLSIVQMPSGIPVATVGVDGAKNAGLLAARMLGLSDAIIAQKLEQFMQNQTQTALDAVKVMEEGHK